MVDTLFHPDAQAEYEAAVAWYQGRSPQASARFEAEVERVIRLIEKNPEIFPKYETRIDTRCCSDFPTALSIKRRLLRWL